MTISKQKIKIMAYIGTSIDFIDGAQVLFEGWVPSPVDALVSVA
jgi:hypothetical protein